MARNRSRIVRGVRRETAWLFIASRRVTMAGASTAVFTASLNAAALAARPFTVIRTLLHLSLKSDQVAQTEAFDAAAGMCVISDQASAIGVTAVPTPMTDLGSDLWFFHKILDGEFLFSSGVGFEAQGVVPSGGITVESKAMRKINDDSDLAIVTETSAVSIGAIMYLAGRLLIKLH